jgi:hypothetical protein
MAAAEMTIPAMIASRQLSGESFVNAGAAAGAVVEVISALLLQE